MNTTDVIAIGVVVLLALAIQLIQLRIRRAMERAAGARHRDPADDPGDDPAQPRRIIVRNNDA